MKNYRRKLILLCLVLLPLTACTSKNNRIDETIPKSPIKYTDSFEKIKAAADAGDVHAMYILSSKDNGVNFTKDQANTYLVKAAEMKHESAQFQLHNYYRRGCCGFPQNYSKAIYWAQRVSCDGRPGSLYLSALYGANISNYWKLVTPDERALVKEDLPLAYAHLKMMGHKFMFGDTDDEIELEARLSPEQKEQAQNLIKFFRSGGCPYDLDTSQNEGK